MEKHSPKAIIGNAIKKTKKVLEDTDTFHASFPIIAKKQLKQKQTVREKVGDKIFLPKDKYTTKANKQKNRNIIYSI